MFCLVKKYADSFKDKLKSGEINPEKLSSMSSEERRAFFSEFLGENNAKEVNRLFESKLLLKNQQAGIINWAKQIAGMKPETLRDIVSRVNRMEEVLNPTNEKAFLNDLVASRLKMGVTMSEAQHISELAKTVQEKKVAIDPNSPAGSSSRMDYGRARVEFGNYVNDLKLEANKTTILEKVKNPIKTFSDTAGLAKSLKASFDNSAIFRQGWKTLWTNPGTWLKNAKTSFSDLVRTFGGKEVMDEIQADIVSRPNYDLMQRAKLAVGTIEEAYPSRGPEKVPVLGRAYKASEVAYTGFVFRQRADIFDKYVDIAKKSGVDLTDTQQIRSIGKLVNSLTGRGSLGKLEPAANVVNNVFFSPRFLKSNIDLLTLHAADAGFSSFARKEAAINLLKVVTGTAAVLVVANAMKPGSVEQDPRSADFGKIRIGDTRFDMTGGISGLVTLVAREITQSTKSSTTGNVSKLNTGAFGGQTGVDVLYNFFENKLSPVSSVVKDLLKGQDFQGNKPTVLGEANNLFTPLPITTYAELKNNPKSADPLLSIIADALGINTNTYSQVTNWNQSMGKELAQFKTKVGDAKFQEANDKYNQTYNDWFNRLKTNPKFQALTDEEKKSVTSSMKTEIKNTTLRKYGFKYNAPPKKALPKFK